MAGLGRRGRRGIPVWIDAIVAVALVAAAVFVLTGGRDEPVAASSAAPEPAVAAEPMGPPTLPTAAPTTAPAPPPSPATTPPAKGAVAPACHPSYQGTCIPPNVVDADCYGINENGPWFVHEENVRVVGPDVFHLDVDFDGIACEGQPGLHTPAG